MTVAILCPDLVDHQRCPACLERWRQFWARFVLRQGGMMSFDLYLHAVDGLARLLHESGRDAVAKGMVYRDDLPVKPFCEWDDLPEKAKEGRRLMAEYVIENQGDFESLLRQATKEA